MDNNLFRDYLTATSKMIAINSVEAQACENAPFGKGVADALSYALALSKTLGFKVVNGDNYYGYAEVGEGELFGMLGHLDTVPIGNDWSVPPLEGLILDDKLYGRGILDDKGPILACLFATAELLYEGKKPKKRIRIIYGCDEESGWQCMDKYLENEEIPTLAFTPDGDFPVINCEKGIVYYDIYFNKPAFVKSIKGGSAPNMVMDSVTVTLDSLSDDLGKDCRDAGFETVGNSITAKGKSAHGSTPQKGDNALHKLVKVLAKHYEEFARLENIICNTDGSGYNIKLSDAVSGDLSVNLGMINSDDWNVHFSLDVRYPVTYTRDQITGLIQNELKDMRVNPGFYHDPLHIDPDHPLLVSLLGAYEKVTGEKLRPITIGGGTYARALPTAVAFGPIFPNQISTIHQKDEYAEISDLKKMYAIYKEAIQRLCF